MRDGLLGGEFLGLMDSSWSDFIVGDLVMGLYSTGSF